MQNSTAPSVLHYGGRTDELSQKFPFLRWIGVDVGASAPVQDLPDLNDCLGCVCIDTDPQLFRDWWSAHIGGPPPGVYQGAYPGLYDAVYRGDMAGLGDWLMQALVADRAGMAAQFDALSRQIGQLRQTNREQHEEIAYLRQQVDGHPKRTLFEIAGGDTLVLAPGAQLRQRLPGQSVGLGGLVLWLKNPAQGQLVIRLIVGGDQDEYARWEIDNPDGAALRLSLAAPLRLPRQSAQILIEWHAQQALHWAGAPVDDPVHGAEIDGKAQPSCLVMRAKNHSFGKGIAPIAPLRERALPRDVLAQAQSDHHDRVMWMDMEQALLVHPVPDGVSAGCLRALVSPGTARIEVEIETLHIRSAPISYAIAIAPCDAPVGDDGVARFDPHHHSPWHTIGARTRQALVFSPPPIDRPHDLWLMTRLPDGATDTSWGMASFSRLSLWA